MNQQETKKHDLFTFDEATLTSVNATPLQIEKAKVRALTKQLNRCLDEKRQIQQTLEHTQNDLERQMHQTLRLQKIQAQKSKCSADASANQVVSTPNDDGKELKAELASTQKDLADEICMSKTREAKIQRLQDQCNSYKEQLESIQQQCGTGDGEGSKHSMEKLIKNLEHQRTELLLVVKKQMKLIDIHKQQRAHIEAATLLGIAEKGFLKEICCR